MLRPLSAVMFLLLGLPGNSFEAPTAAVNSPRRGSIKRRRQARNPVQGQQRERHSLGCSAAPIRLTAAFLSPIVVPASKDRVRCPSAVIEGYPCGISLPILRSAGTLLIWLTPTARAGIAKAWILYGIDAHYYNRDD